MMMKYVIVALIALFGSTEAYHHNSHRRTIVAKENVKIAMSTLIEGIDEMKAALDSLKAAQDTINADNQSGLNDAPEQALADAKAALDAIIAEHELNNTNKISTQTADYVGSATAPVLSFRALVQGIDEMKAALDTLKAAQATINADNPSGLNETPEQALADAKAALDAIIAEHELNNADKISTQTADYVGSATAPDLSFSRRSIAKGIDEMKAALDTLKAAQDTINGDNHLANGTPEAAVADAVATLDAIIAEHELNNTNKINAQTADYVGSATAPVLSFNRRALDRGIDDMKAALDTLHAAQDEINADNPTGLNDAPEQALADAKATLDAIIAEHEVNNANKIAQQTADYVTSTAFTHLADTFDILESSTYALENNLRRANIV